MLASSWSITYESTIMYFKCYYSYCQMTDLSVHPQTSDDLWGRLYPAPHTQPDKYKTHAISHHKVTLLYQKGILIIFMPYYGLLWTWSPYLDLRWRSRSTGTIPELLITSIARHKNKNRWVGDPLWRSCSLFCVGIFHKSSEISLHKTMNMISTGDPPLTCSCYNSLDMLQESLNIGAQFWNNPDMQF